jgi:NRPS condensation-like uncharacterized protein
VFAEELKIRYDGAVRVPLNAPEELTLFLNDPTRPPTIHVEANVEGRLDESRLGQAIGTAAGTHPLARARLAPWSSDAPAYEWAIDDEPEIDPLRVKTVGDSADLDEIRSELYSRPITLFESPPFRALLLHHPAGDFLMLSINHVACDGIGALRLLQSVLRAYAGVPDPTVDINPADALALAAPAVGRGLRDHLHRGRMNLQQLGQMRSRPANIAAKDPTPRPGYGVQSMSLPVAALAGSPLRRRLGATVNDVLVAAVHRAVDGWNRMQGKDTGCVSIAVAVNTRPEEWRYEVVANLVSAETVSTTTDQRRSFESCVAAVAAQTEAAKRRGIGTLLAVPTKPLAGRVSQRRPFGWLVQASVNLIGGTAGVSNIGRVAPNWVDADDLRVKELRLSPPAVGSLGIGAVSMEDTLNVTLRYRHSAFSRDAAASFADVVRAELDSLSAS